MTQGAKLEGFEEMFARFERMDDLDWVSAQVEGVQVMVDEAKLLVPVDTGALQDSIRVEVDGEMVQMVAGGNGVDYSLYVEFGTSRMEAQPYMTPAIENKQAECLKVMAANLEKQVKEKVAV